MKIIKIIMFLVVVSILTSIFMLSSCEAKETGGKLKIIDSDTATIEDINMENENKVFDVKIGRNRFYPSLIQVDKRDFVLLKLTSDEENGFELKEYDLNTRVPKNLQVKLGFLADKEGEFTFTCGNYCQDITEDFGEACGGEEDCPEYKEDADVLGKRLLKGKLIVR